MEMYADVDGVRLHYDVSGEGPPVVLIPGLTGINGVWKHVIPVLEREFSVLTFDQRGIGRSSGREGPHSVPSLAEDARELIDHLGFDTASIVGISMGGGIAQTFTLTHPERVDALALVSTSSEFDDDARRLFAWRAETARRDGMASTVEQQIGVWYSPQYRATHPEEVEATRRAIAAIDPSVFAARCVANAERSWTDRLGEITCPVLFVGGGLDPMDPPVHLERFRRHIPQLEGHIIGGVAHAVPVAAPGEFNAILLGFLRRVHGAETPV